MKGKENDENLWFQFTIYIEKEDSLTCPECLKKMTKITMGAAQVIDGKIKKIIDGFGNEYQHVKKAKYSVRKRDGACYTVKKSITVGMELKDLEVLFIGRSCNISVSPILETFKKIVW